MKKEDYDILEEIVKLDTLIYNQYFILANYDNDKSSKGFLFALYLIRDYSLKEQKLYEYFKKNRINTYKVYKYLMNDKTYNRSLFLNVILSFDYDNLIRLRIIENLRNILNDDLLFFETNLDSFMIDMLNGSASNVDLCKKLFSKYKLEDCKRSTDFINSEIGKSKDIRILRFIKYFIIFDNPVYENYMINNHFKNTDRSFDNNTFTHNDLEERIKLYHGFDVIKDVLFKILDFKHEDLNNNVIIQKLNALLQYLRTALLYIPDKNLDNLKIEIINICNTELDDDGYISDYNKNLDCVYNSNFIKSSIMEIFDNILLDKLVSSADLIEENKLRGNL